MIPITLKARSAGMKAYLSSLEDEPSFPVENQYKIGCKTCMLLDDCADACGKTWMLTASPCGSFIGKTGEESHQMSEAWQAGWRHCEYIVVTSGISRANASIKSRCKKCGCFATHKDLLFGVHAGKCPEKHDLFCGKCGCFIALSLEQVGFDYDVGYAHSVCPTRHTARDTKGRFCKKGNQND